MLILCFLKQYTSTAILYSYNHKFIKRRRKAHALGNGHKRESACSWGVLMAGIGIPWVQDTKAEYRLGNSLFMSASYSFPTVGIPCAIARPLGLKSVYFLHLEHLDSAWPLQSSGHPASDWTLIPTNGAAPPHILLTHTGASGWKSVVTPARRQPSFFRLKEFGFAAVLAKFRSEGILPNRTRTQKKNRERTSFVSHWRKITSAL